MSNHSNIHNSSTGESNIEFARPLIPPHALIQALSPSEEIVNHVVNSRAAIREILQQQNNRLLVIVGPCSIHDPVASLEYAQRLKELSDQLAEDLFIIMRTYLDKPRTTTGWRGLINDPHLNGSFDILAGLKTARKFLLDVNALGLPTASEFLDPITPPYFSDLISWGVIGARTSESQLHRQIASGLPMPIGFKNSTDGNVQIAIDAVKIAHLPQYYVGISAEGKPAIISTKGNPNCHIILRGSRDETNYESHHVLNAALQLQKNNLNTCIMVDCSHGNSQKEFQHQIQVAKNLATQLKEGNSPIKGIMLESFLIEGRQTYHQSQPLVYGQSITDACLAWENTVPLLKELAFAMHSIKRQFFTSSHQTENISS